MSKDKKKDYGYVNKDENDRIFYIEKGRVATGYTIGILVLIAWSPRIPGNVANADTFDFPVRHKMIPNALPKRVTSGDPSLLNDIIKAGRELEQEGVRAICGACGYLGNYQRQVAEKLSIPVYLSSLIQVPFIKAGLRPQQKIGVLCADEPSLTPEILKNCGINNPEICVVKGIGDKPEFSAISHGDRGHFDNEGIKKEVVNEVQKLVLENPNVGAILLECSDMPPYSYDVQRAVNLPVFDFITMIKWVHNAVAQKHYYGFI